MELSVATVIHWRFVKTGLITVRVTKTSRELVSVDEGAVGTG